MVRVSTATMLAAAVLRANAAQRDSGGIPTPTPTSTQGTIAASNGQLPLSFISPTLPYLTRTVHYAHPLAAISNVRPVWVGYVLDTTFGLVNVASSFTIKASLEYPVDSGTFFELLFGGSTVGTVTPGGQLIPDANSWPCPAGAAFGVRTEYVTLPSDGKIPAWQLPATPAALGVNCKCANATAPSATATTTSGTVSRTSTASNTTFFAGPAAIKGDVAIANAPAIVLLVDSLGVGYNQSGSAGTKGGIGFWKRGVEDLAPEITFGRQGISVYQIIASNTLTKLGSLLAALNLDRPNAYGVVEVGLNDISQGANRTSSQILADRATLAAALPANMRKLAATLTPRTSSTDSWATVANQTLKSDGSMSTAWQATNNAVRAGEAWRYAVLDAESWAGAGGGLATHVWGSPFPASTDGTHPADGKIAAMATLVKADVQALNL